MFGLSIVCGFTFVFGLDSVEVSTMLSLGFVFVVSWLGFVVFDCCLVGFAVDGLHDLYLVWGLVLLGV